MCLKNYLNISDRRTPQLKLSQVKHEIEFRNIQWVRNQIRLAQMVVCPPRKQKGLGSSPGPVKIFHSDYGIFKYLHIKDIKICNQHTH